MSAANEHVSAFDAILNSMPPPRVNGTRVISPMSHADDIQEEPPMPTGVYKRKGDAAPKRRGRPPKVAAVVTNKTRGQYSDVLAELRAKRDQIDAAIAAIEALA